MEICTVPWLWGHCFQYRGQYKVEKSQCLLFSTEWEYFFHLCLIRQRSRGLSVWRLCVLPGLSASLWHTLIFLTNFLSALDMSNSCFRIVPQRPAVESTKAWKHTGSLLQYRFKMTLNISRTLCALAPAEGGNDCGWAMWAVLYHCGKGDGPPAPEIMALYLD